MKNKKFLMLLCVLFTFVLICAAAVVYMTVNSLGFSVGRCLITTDGSCLMICGNVPIKLSSRTQNGDDFVGLSNGDRILVLHDGIEETYPGRTLAYAIFRLSSGSFSDIPEEVLTQLEGLGYRVNHELTLTETMPEDFSFALTFGTYGISSYDSRTGRLVKTSDSTHPKDYVTELWLSGEQMEQIYRRVLSLEPNSYPTVYDPHKNMTSYPSMTLILTVRANGEERVIMAKDVALTYKANNKKGQVFLDACCEIRDILISSDEWKALPDYEFYYD